jgi:hypothetical protein
MQSVRVLSFLRLVTRVWVLAALYLLLFRQVGIHLDATVALPG